MIAWRTDLSGSGKRSRKQLFNPGVAPRTTQTRTEPIAVQKPLHHEKTTELFWCGEARRASLLVAYVKTCFVSEEINIFLSYSCSKSDKSIDEKRCFRLWCLSLLNDALANGVDSNIEKCCFCPFFYTRNSKRKKRALNLFFGQRGRVCMCVQTWVFASVRLNNRAFEVNNSYVRSPKQASFLRAQKSSIFFLYVQCILVLNGLCLESYALACLSALVAVALFISVFTQTYLSHIARAEVAQSVVSVYLSSV